MSSPASEFSAFFEKARRKGSERFGLSLQSQRGKALPLGRLEFWAEAGKHPFVSVLRSSCGFREKKEKREGDPL
ncbi:hypothetical protein GCWU000341_02767 [Oribacterium sp. oral taxon 078 str. F0262]|nr:hypothetical protein GCWU000341_02767 [Oribacterium sp. oral taxon 078 str. F0262]